MHHIVTDPRRVAELLLTMRVMLIRKLIAELRGDLVGQFTAEGNLDGIAQHLPLRLRTPHALHKYVGYPARRTIERYGAITLAETNGYRPW